jgi:hypothetical protein
MMVVVIVVFYFVSQRFNQMAEEQQKAQEAAGLPPDEQPWLPKSVEPGGPEAGGIQDKSLREGIMDPDKKDDRPSS